MAGFWFWGVRNPCVALAAIAFAAGWRGFADTSIAFTIMLAFGAVAEIATHVGRRARTKQRRNAAARRAITEATELRERVKQRQAA